MKQVNAHGPEGKESPGFIRDEFRQGLWNILSRKAGHDREALGKLFTNLGLRHQFIREFSLVDSHRLEGPFARSPLLLFFLPGGSWHGIVAGFSFSFQEAVQKLEAHPQADAALVGLIQKRATLPPF
jgi:hypothetical protein